jgi:hypothetical protein
MQVLPTLPSPTMTNLTGIGYCDIKLQNPTIYYNPKQKKSKNRQLIKITPSPTITLTLTLTYTAYQ